jgi:hypothetical protein
MALPEPREGLSLGFSSRPSAFDEATIGDPEHYLWTSIRHWGVGEYADNALEDIHGVTNKRFRETIIKPTPHNSICGRTKAQRRGACSLYSPECVEGEFCEVHLSVATDVPKIRKLREA